MSGKYTLITPEDIFKHPQIHAYIEAGNNCLGAIGFTEHGFAHAKRTSNYARDILHTMGYAARDCELAAIAGYMHDIGNMINRADHAHSGALMAFQILSGMDMPPEEVAVVCGAIGHHDEKTAHPVNAQAGALILSDKTDVRRTRVRKDAVLDIDIHDRVNYAVENASLKIEPESGVCIFNIKIDTKICPVMEYFEIFLERMVLCRKAASFFNLQFELIINDTRLL